MKRGSSLRRTECPSPRHSTIGFSLHLRGSVLDGLHDVDVPGAAAEVSRDPPADLFLGWAGVVLQERDRSHHHARSAVAALQTVLLHEAFLDGVEVSVLGQTLHRRDLGAVGLDREHGATLDRASVHEHGAGAAGSRVAADVRSGEVQLLADEVDEEKPGFHLPGVGLPVQLERNLVGAHAAPPALDSARFRAWVKARFVKVRTRCLLYSSEPRWSSTGSAASEASLAASAMAPSLGFFPSSDSAAAFA